VVKVILKKHEAERIEHFHPWVFDNEVKRIEGIFSPGDIVDVYSHDHHFLGRGYINPRSKILVRLLTRQEEEINRAFFERRLAAAWQSRLKLLPDTNSCRVVFGEADFLPALVVDKFADYLSIQTLALGIDKYKDVIASLLDEMLKPQGIYERNDAQVRTREGLAEQKGFLKGPFPTEIVIRENELKMLVDIDAGQKTGYFLDQRENRAAIRPYVQGARVLDAFSYTGGFALHAALYGACAVTAVDSSEPALDWLRRNADLNALGGKIACRTANVFDLLREYEQQGADFDVIILDPPAFAKSRAALATAYRGYKEINLRALKLLTPGGFLITCSCSHYMEEPLFLSMLSDAAADARRPLRIIEIRGQAKDHPLLSGFAESRYLKCVIAQA
jgi:23S rRNA (cytosine1962-C5)-methyltransferase